MTDPAARSRAVVLVGNPAAPYSRGLRIARALHAAGYDVEIAAVAEAGLAARETDGPVEIRRYAPSGPYARMAARYRDPATPAGRRMPRAVRAIRAGPAAIRRWLFWPHTVRGWWATLDRALAPADLYHACGSLTVAPALAARARDRRAGRRSRVIYDAIDDVVAGNNMLGTPAPLRAWHGRTERRWARAADARTTVNDELAGRLAARWGTPPPVVVPNYPEPWTPPSGSPPDLIRSVLGLPPTTRIVLFQGRLGPNLGLDEAAAAILRVPDAALVLIGFGRWAERCVERDRQPPFAGRHFTLPPRHPDELAAWTASADVSLVPLPPVSVNQRLSTPNKLWESLAVGTPIVVGPGLDVMVSLVSRFDLGIVARSLAPGDLANAICTVLDRPPAVRAAERARIAGLAAERFSWSRAAAAYIELVGPPER